MNAQPTAGAELSRQNGRDRSAPPRFLRGRHSHEPPCFHGGAFFDAIGADFRHLEKRRHIINADVLDAWFDPAPAVVESLREHLPWLIRTSPPTHCDGLIDAIASARGIPRESVLPGAGSSDLIFLALRHWLGRASRVLILDPTYGEYTHVLRHVIGCRVESISLRRAENYDLGLEELSDALARDYELVILVNPNSPTGRHIPRTELQNVLKRVPLETCVWVDETYVDYVGSLESLEQFAVRTSNVLVCKSMSKVYALSGARAAYLAGPVTLIDSLRAYTPPWAVSLPAQLAATRALEESSYYRARYAETHLYRVQLQRGLAALALDVVEGCANSLLFHLPACMDALDFAAHCQERGLFVRNASLMSASLGGRAIRIAVKDPVTNSRMLAIIREVLNRAVRRGTHPNPAAR